MAFGKAVRSLRQHLPPHVRLYGVVAAHSTSGTLDTPEIENARPSSQSIGDWPVPVVNPLALLEYVHQVLPEAPDVHMVDARLLRRMLELQQDPPVMATWTRTQ